MSKAILTTGNNFFEACPKILIQKGHCITVPTSGMLPPDCYGILEFSTVPTTK